VDIHLPACCGTLPISAPSPSPPCRPKLLKYIEVEEKMSGDLKRDLAGVPTSPASTTGFSERRDDAESVEKKDYNTSARNSQDISPTSYKSPGSGHVDVKRAEAEFNELNRELKLTLQQSRSSRHGKQLDINDLEKSTSSISDEEAPFDLEGTLRGNRQAAEEAGIKSKQIGVIWNDLSVRGIGGVTNYVKTFPMAFVSFFNVFPMILGWCGLGKKGKEVDILKSFRGVINPGEMVLVLGRPGSGCTTFLKIISNQRYGYTDISGDVLYGPFDHSTFSNRYRGEAVYNAEDESNTMHPTLTVAQTLSFALDTKVPGTRPAGLSRADFKSRVIDMLLKMFNIEVSKKIMGTENQFERCLFII
jgi:ATP-binding cassette subfamily G (WHITE) protein 2 (SNQ2)